MINQNETGWLSQSLKFCVDREAALIDDLLCLLDTPLPSRPSFLAILDQLLVNLARQFELASREGFLARVIQLRPGWHREVQVLGGANVDCVMSLRAIRDRIVHSRSSASINVNERREIDEWIRSLLSQRSHESRLQQAAFTLAVGGEA